jgi:hypothetical protein
MMADELNINKETIRQSSMKITEEKNVRKIRPTQTHGRTEATETLCQGFIQTWQENLNFLYCNFLFPKMKTLLK